VRLASTVSGKSPLVEVAATEPLAAVAAAAVMTAVALKRTRLAGAVCGLLLLLLLFTLLITLLLLLLVAGCLVVRAAPCCGAAAAAAIADAVLLASALLACSSVSAKWLPALRGLDAVRRVTSDVICEYRSVQAASHASCRCRACVVSQYNHTTVLASAVLLGDQ
jgi:hypothetical protein